MLDRQIDDRLRRLERLLGDDFGRLRAEAGATKSAVAAAAGVDRTFYGRIEAGLAQPSLETIVALATALGADASIRLFSGRGPRLTDRHQSRMEEALIAELGPVWRPHPEVAVWQPVRGVIDTVLERLDEPLLVAGEFESTLTRLEQQIRWANQKCEAIGSSELLRDRPVPRVSRLLVLRSTDTNRTLARSFERTLRTAYPCRAADAVRSLREGSPWPGDSIVWVRIDGDVTRLLDGPPRGVALGR